VVISKWPPGPCCWLNKDTNRNFLKKWSQELSIDIEIFFFIWLETNCFLVSLLNPWWTLAPHPIYCHVTLEIIFNLSSIINHLYHILLLSWYISLLTSFYHYYDLLYKLFHQRWLRFFCAPDLCILRNGCTRVSREAKHMQPRDYCFHVFIIPGLDLHPRRRSWERQGDSRSGCLRHDTSQVAGPVPVVEAGSNHLLVYDTSSISTNVKGFLKPKFNVPIFDSISKMAHRNVLQRTFSLLGSFIQLRFLKSNKNENSFMGGSSPSGIQPAWIYHEKYPR
jgi:hypothetical protein